MDENEIKTDIVLNVLTPLDDMTLESFAASIWLCNPLASWKDLVRSAGIVGITLRGVSSRAIPLVHHRFVGDALGYDTFVKKHSFLPLLQPFLDPSAYKKLHEVTAAGKSPAIRSINRLAAINPDLRACHRCAAEEIELNGFGYAKRSHQVRGVTLCHVHGSVLSIVCPEPVGLTPHGIFHEQSLYSMVPLSDRDPLDANRLYATFSAFALSGALPRVHSQARRRSYLTSLNEMGARTTPAQTLTKLVRASFGTELLRTIGLDPTGGPSAGWPAMLLHGNQYSTHPLVQLLTMSVLFQRPQEAIHAMSPSQEDIQNDKQAPDETPPGETVSPLTLSTVKEMLRAPSLAAISRRQAICQAQLEQILNQLPILKERRNRLKQKRKRDESRKSILGLNRDRSAFSNSLLSSTGKFCPPRIHSLPIQREMQLIVAYLTKEHLHRARRSRKFLKSLTTSNIWPVSSAAPNKHIVSLAFNALVELPHGYQERVEKEVSRLVSVGLVEEAKLWLSVAIGDCPKMERFLRKRFPELSSASPATRNHLF